MKSFSKSAAVLAGGLVFAGSASGASFFEDFEIDRGGAGADSNVVGNSGQWTTDFGTYGSATTYDGSDHAADVPGGGNAIGHTLGATLNVPNAAGGGVADGGILSNAVAIGAGETQYDFSIWMAGYASDSAVLAVAWYDNAAGDSLLSIETLADGSAEGSSTTPSGAWTNTNWSNYTGSGTVAGGAVSFRVILAGNAVGGGADNYVDNISFSTSVPEPGSLALLGLGGLAMLRRRR